MSGLRLDNLNLIVAERVKGFVEGILNAYPSKNIHSVYVVGSSITEDFDVSHSDINMVVVLKEMDMDFLNTLISLGKPYRKQKIKPPLIMTPLYIKNSLDIFPIEFMEIKLIHKVILGEDLFDSIKIEKKYLRIQCERELKSRLIGLRHGYISSLGNADVLREYFVSSLSGYIPIFRGILSLFDKPIHIKKSEVIKELATIDTSINTDVFATVLDIKRGKLKLSKDKTYLIFKDYYNNIERLVNIVDAIKI